MTNYKQGDLILFPYPFDDFSSSKKRPAIIFGNALSKVGAYIVAKVTSVLKPDTHSFLLDNQYLTAPTPIVCEVRCNEIATISETIIIKKLSSLDKNELIKLTNIVKKNFDIK